MFKLNKASSATHEASGASEKKIKKNKKTTNTIKSGFKLDFVTLRKGFGYATAITFVALAISQTSSAVSNINSASIIYNNELARMQEEAKKAQQAVVDKLNVNIDDDKNISPKDPFSDEDYYIDEDGNIVRTDKDGNTSIYHFCITCSKCGYIADDTEENISLCPQCGSDMYRYTVYRVEKGDTLAEISGKVGASVNSIANLNELEDVNLIYAGESLRIPQ